MKTAIYANVTPIYYAVALTDMGCIEAGQAIINLYDESQSKLLEKIRDWCADQNVATNRIGVKLGYLPGQPTEHWVGNWRRDWIQLEKPAYWS